MNHSGIERRRTDLYGRVRRATCGLLILAGVPTAAFAGKGTAHPVRHSVSPTTVKAAMAPKPAFPLVAARAAALDPQTQEHLSALGIEELEVDHRWLGPARDGVGLDLAMPNTRGHFHLNLYSKRSPKSRGQRFALDPQAERESLAQSNRWSLGGSVQVHGRQPQVVPELIFQLDRDPADLRTVEATFSFANWKNSADKTAGADVGKVPQLRVKWKF